MNNDERRRFEIASNRCLSNCLPHLDRFRRARPLGAPRPAELSSECVGANPCVRPCHSRQIVLFIDTTVQTYNFAPLRGASLSCFAKKVTKEGDLGEALRLCCGNTSTFRYYPRQPKFALPQDPLPRCAKSLYCISRFCKLFDKFLFIELFAVP